MEKRRKKREKLKEIRRDYHLKFSKKSLKNTPFANNSGIRVIPLTKLTQKYVGCQIGVEVTPENPWIYIQKEKIEDNLYLHETSSEFLSIKQYIECYPEPEVLVGYLRPHQDTNDDEFIICTTIEGKEDILIKIEEEKNSYEKKGRVSITRYSRVWHSLGSEEDVTGEINFNNRPLLKVSIRTSFPIFNEKIKFKYRLAGVVNNIYTETFPSRFSYNLIQKKRICTGTQVGPVKVNVEVQTVPLYPRNIYTQYHFEYEEINLNEKENQKLLKFFHETANNICSSLLFNSNVNLYSDDYEFSNAYIQSQRFVPTDIFSFQDVINCKNKKISDLSWNALISGIIAASYVQTPIYNIMDSEPVYNDAFSTVFAKNLVLIWSYSDLLLPKLFLHSSREVSFLSFCPYDENILIGGCENGQLVIWDISNRLRQVEARDILSDLQQKHHIIINNNMKWMKPSPDINNVYPAVMSLLDWSHKSPLTSIQWLPKTHYIDNYGKVQQCETDEERMQFLTSSLEDSFILLWDLKNKETEEDSKSKKRSQRLSRAPKALSDDISKYKEANSQLKPFLKLKIENPLNNANIFATFMLTRFPDFCYTPLNPETVYDSFQRTLFKNVTTDEPVELSQSLIVCTASGNICAQHWTALNFDHGLKVNTILCKNFSFLNIHDGPVQTCRVSPFDSKYLLTIGGKIFAIWDETVKDPILWRKRNCRLCSGIWSVVQPCSIFVARADNYFELWNFLENTEKPVRYLKYKGNPILDIFSDYKDIHVRKKTFATTDTLGSVRIYTIPKKRFVKKRPDRAILIEKLNAFVSRKKNILQLLEQLKNKIKLQMTDNFETKLITSEVVASNNNSLDEEEESNESEETPEPEEIKGNKNIIAFKLKQERMMYQVLLEQKRLNIVDIERQKTPLFHMLHEKMTRQNKLDAKIANRDVFFEKIKNAIIKPTHITGRKQIEVRYPMEFRKELKKTYLKEYYAIEKESLEFVENNPLVFVFDFQSAKEAKQNYYKQYLIYQRHKYEELQSIKFFANASDTNTYVSSEEQLALLEGTNNNPL